MTRLLALPFLVAFACLAAALYGALHNQISYTIGPSYFTELKFAQFAIPPELHNRAGAALVGVLASWWMGLIIGLPIALITALARRPARLFLRATLITLVAAAIGAALSYALSLAHSDADLAQTFPQDPSFIRAAALHDGSYIGAALGFLLALWRTLRALRDDRR